MAGSTRRIAPLRPTGSPVVRRSWLRSAPPSAVGGNIAADASRRIAAGVDRRAVLPVVDEVEAGAVAAAHVEGAVGTERQAPDRVARVLLAPVLDQHLLGADHRVAGRLEPRQAAGDDAAVRGRAGRRRAAVRRAAHRSPPRRRAADGGVEGVEDVDPRVVGKFGASARPSSPRSQKLWTWVRRSANTVGVVSDRLSKTLMSPLFSATKTRPSGENRTAVGWVSPRRRSPPGTGRRRRRLKEATQSVTQKTLCSTSAPL